MKRMEKQVILAKCLSEVELGESSGYAFNDKGEAQNPLGVAVKAADFFLRKMKEVDNVEVLRLALGLKDADTLPSDLEEALDSLSIVNPDITTPARELIVNTLQTKLLGRKVGRPARVQSAPVEVVSTSTVETVSETVVEPTVEEVAPSFHETEAVESEVVEPDLSGDEIAQVVTTSI